jgi:hypothetical protein
MMGQLSSELNRPWSEHKQGTYRNTNKQVNCIQYQDIQEQLQKIYTHTTTRQIIITHQHKTYSMTEDADNLHKIIFSL